jgi:hypothetical protein
MKEDLGFMFLRIFLDKPSMTLASTIEVIQFGRKRKEFILRMHLFIENFMGQLRLQSIWTYTKWMKPPKLFFTIIWSGKKGYTMHR